MRPRVQPGWQDPNPMSSCPEMGAQVSTEKTRVQNIVLIVFSYHFSLKINDFLVSGALPHKNQLWDNFFQIFLWILDPLREPLGAQISKKRKNRVRDIDGIHFFLNSWLFGDSFLKKLCFIPLQTPILNHVWVNLVIILMELFLFFNINSPSFFLLGSGMHDP